MTVVLTDSHDGESRRARKDRAEFALSCALSFATTCAGLHGSSSSSRELEKSHRQ